MDYCKIMEKEGKNLVSVYPSFQVSGVKDLLVRGRDFYAVWDEENNTWSTNILTVQRLVDQAILSRVEKMRSISLVPVVPLELRTYGNHTWTEFNAYLKQLPDCGIQLDSKLTFTNTPRTRDDYTSKTLPYALEAGDYSAWDELISTLYEPEEREKIEWSIGAIVSGEAKNIQKFLVFYGEPGSGKSTILNIIEKLFAGYTVAFEASSLASYNNQFATEVFRSNPLVAIQHDGDLSRIEDNTKLNSIISHENMTIHEKYKAGYTARINCFLMLATNKPVKISDAKSGIIRRLIDVHPSGGHLSRIRYDELMSQINFQLGAIAFHCLDVYRSKGPSYYDHYRSYEMVAKTDVFYNFVEENYFVFKEQDGCTLKQAYGMYKQYCEDTLVEWRLPMYRFREELKNYFVEFYPVTRIDDKQVRSYYKTFLGGKFVEEEEDEDVPKDLYSLHLDCTISNLDTLLADAPAQYANKAGTPTKRWAINKTKLRDLDTSQLHYVKLPENHIVIDFDLKNPAGEKSDVLNLMEASKWPPTYAEFSKSGKGVHLHYIYDGDPSMLDNIYADGIEIKVFAGDASLRRKVTRCNNLQVATIRSGLPLKGEKKKVINFKSVKNEKGIRTLIELNLQKRYHAGTKPSIDFIYKILEDAYNGGVKYDVSDMRPRVLAFANNSTNHADYCVRLVAKMHFHSDEASEAVQNQETDDRLVFFDCEVFPNLFLINWKYQGDSTVVRMINPSPSEVGELFNFKLVGFNNRRYDNHILYARYIGYNNLQLYELSQKIISGSRNAMFGEAYNISYTDIYDFSSAGNKQSLKKWEIALDLHHKELGLPWDEPVPEDKWQEVAEYCDNDVISTEAVFDHLKGDWAVRRILAKISGLSVNDTTNQHSTRIVFGQNKNPQDEFNYRNLSEYVTEIDSEKERFLKERTPIQIPFNDKSILPYFPGYKFEGGKSIYRGEEVGEGGYVYAEPGIYYRVGLLDIASMHPSSIEAEYLFGKYTWNFSDVKNARVSFKHNDRDRLDKLLNGTLSQFVELADKGEFEMNDVADGMKTVINSAYGLTSASFPNAFRDPRNIDNIVAKRGALFMIDLKNAVQDKGYTVVHIKTDSIKIANVDDEIIKFVMDFGKKYGYSFEHEATYDRMCLVNNAVYIAKYDDKGIRNKGGKKANQWTATGAEFAHPYIFKTLFSHEEIEFKDLCETKASTYAVYLDMNEGLKDDKHNYVFVGKVGQYCPIRAGKGGGQLVWEKEGKYNAVGGTKDYRWLESEVIKGTDKEDDIDLSYFQGLVEGAYADISKYGDAEAFINGEECAAPYQVPEAPWSECESPYFPSCADTKTGCPYFDRCYKQCKIPF